LQFSVNFEQKCNYWATLEGVALGHHLREWVKHRDGSGFGKIIAGFYLIIEMAVNLVDDAIGLSLAFQSTSQRGGDIFNVGLILGKVSKIVVQLYLEGIMFKDYRDY